MDGEIITGHIDAYKFRILGDPKFEGTNAVYSVELMANTPNGVPSDRLLPGERFSIEAAYVEKELSRKVGDNLLIINVLKFIVCLPIQ